MTNYLSAIPVLSLLLALPLVGALATSLVSSRRPEVARSVALFFSVLVALLVAWIGVSFQPSATGYQFEESVWWIRALRVQYHLGLDGLSFLLVLLTAVLTPFAIALPSGIREKQNVYYALILCLQGIVFGVFLSLDFVLWFLFWELSLIPGFFLIKVWGGEKRGFAAYQFFLYTLAGSVPMLVGFLALFLATGIFDFTKLAGLSQSQILGGIVAQFPWAAGFPDLFLLGIFVCVFVGLAVKVPVIPLHTWLPEAYTQAPSGVTMLFTGLLSKMGVYGFLRILLPIFPEQMQTLQQPLLWLAVATIVLPTLVALVQTDLKKILAYSSINHLGYCLLGICAVVSVGGAKEAKEAALSGVVLQVFNHGVTAAALFAFVGLIEVRSGGLRSLGDFGGLRKVAPVFCGLMGISLFASLGLPGLNGFVGEFLIFRGVFPLASWAAVLSLPALLFTAVVFLRVLAKVFSGPLNPVWESFPDLRSSERWLMAPLVALMFGLGIYPGPLLNLFNQSVVTMIQFLP